MKVFRYRRPSLKILLRITTAKRRVKKEGWALPMPEAIPVVYEHETLDQAKDRLRIGCRTTDVEGIAEAGSVCGGDDRGAFWRWRRL